MSSQPTIAIRDLILVNEGETREVNLLIKSGVFHSITPTDRRPIADITIEAGGSWGMAGAIDDQVHFREPGLTHKAEIATESRAAVAGGVTSFMEMPNTNPTTTNARELAAKKARAAEVSAANYAFFLGATNDNLEDVLAADPRHTAGIKIFMGSSTGNMLVDNTEVLENIFKHSPMLIATHCEDEATIRANLERAREEFGDHIPTSAHPEIRNVEACLKSSTLAVELAKKHGTRLHVLHISTEEELALFAPYASLPVFDRKITCEACVHHLWFTADDYVELGNQIKCNPAIKAPHHRDALRKALREGVFAVVATDHAPHTLEEKQANYLAAPAGLPLVQHSILIMLELVSQGVIALTDVPNYMAHRVSDLFQVENRGYVREGYFADLAVINPQKSTTVTKQSLHYKAGWSPLEGHTFAHAVETVLVSGNLALSEGKLNPHSRGMALTFNR